MNTGGSGPYWEDERLSRWRADTPGCNHRNHLNNAGAGLMPADVIDAITAHIRLESKIGGYEAEADRRGEIERSYNDIAALLNAAPHNVAMMANATAGFIQVLSVFDWQPGDAIVTTRCDYTSNQIQYLALRARHGVTVHHADDLPEGGVDPDSVRDLLRRHQCRLVALTWVPTNSGLVQDAESIGEICSEMEVPYLVDACQAVGQMVVDVGRLRCDYLTASARKFLRGPRGIGFLYASDRALNRGEHPLFVDMRGARWTATDRYEVDPTARRFEDWEAPYALVLGQGAAVRYALAVGLDTARSRASALAADARTRLAEIPGVRVLDRGRELCAIVTIAVAGRSAPDMVAQLAGRGINTTASLREYGRLDFDAKGVDAAVRISPHYYNEQSEIDRLVEATDDIMRAGAAAADGCGSR